MEMKELRAIVITALCEATTKPATDFDLPDNAPFHQLAIDSMALFSVLLSLEKTLENGDITQLSADTPAPKTFGQLLQLAARIGKLDSLSQ